jgi:hypothetical protein
MKPKQSNAFVKTATTSNEPNSLRIGNSVLKIVSGNIVESTVYIGFVSFRYSLKSI